jgi:hypothetical protein
MSAKCAAWILLSLVLVVAPSPAFAQSSNPSSRQVTHVRDGTIATIDYRTNTVTIRHTPAGQPTTQSVIWVQHFTRLSVEEADAERVATLATLHPGDRIVVEGFRLDDGRLLAVVVKAKRGLLAATTPTGTHATNRATAQSSASSGTLARPRAEADSPSQPSLAGAQLTGAQDRLKGVVTGRGASSLDVVDIGGVRRRVNLTGSVRVEGQRGSISAIAARDFIVAAGTLNADGSLTAQSIDVVLAARNVITGRITATGNGFVVIDGNRTVRVTADTLVLVDGKLRSVADLRVGTEISISGVAEPAGGSGGGDVSGTLEIAGGATAGGAGLVGTVIDVVSK